MSATLVHWCSGTIDGVGGADGPLGNNVPATTERICDRLCRVGGGSGPSGEGAVGREVHACGRATDRVGGTGGSLQQRASES